MFKVLLPVTGTSYSSVNVRDAYVTFGNLGVLPVYLTVGKVRLSFGSFNDGAPWYSGITQGMFRPGHNTVSANLGLNLGKLSTQDYNFNLNVATFQTDNDNNDKANFMVSGFYDFDNKTVKAGGNLGYIYNWIGTGMGGAQFAQNDNAGSPNVVSKDRNGIINMESYLGLDKYFTLYGGLTTATNKENYSNNSYFGAWYIQGEVPLPINYGKFVQGVNFGVSYQQSYNAQNLAYQLAGDSSDNGGPSIIGVHKEFLLYAQAPVLSKNNLVGLEYGRLNLYNGQNTNEITVDISTYF